MRSSGFSFCFSYSLSMGQTHLKVTPSVFPSAGVHALCNASPWRSRKDLWLASNQENMTELMEQYSCDAITLGLWLSRSSHVEEAHMAKVCSGLYNLSATLKWQPAKYRSPQLYSHSQMNFANSLNELEVDSSQVKPPERTQLNWHLGCTLSDPSREPR